MAIPLYDSLQVDLSERLEDAVAAATSNGVKWTSAQRDAFMNEGIRRWHLKWLMRYLQGDPRAQEALQNYVVESSQALSSSKTSLSGLTTTPANAGALHIIEVYNSTTPAYVYPMPRRLKLSYSLNQFLDEQYWTISDGSIEVIGSGTTDTVNVRFIEGHVNHAANTGSDDILVPSSWWPEVLDMATVVGLESDPDSQNLTRATVLDNRHA